jgi:hypothetical protein
MSTSNGTTNGAYDIADEAIDSLYSFWPGMQPAVQPCPEALFSLTLRGKLDGVETLLTVRGQSAAEFKRNLAEVRGLLDSPQPAAAPVQSSSPGEGWCRIHGVQMKENTKDGRRWYSHQVDGQWCKGR